MKLTNLKAFVTDPTARFSILSSRGLLNRMSDEIYLKKCFELYLGKPLNLDNPTTYNEKIQWLKLHDRRSIYTTMADKYEAKRYVAERIGEEYIIPTLGVWNKFEEIDFESLPEQFVLKCTHDSGGLVIVTDKAKMNLKEARRKINKSLKRNYYYRGREWQYKNITPRIIAEKYMANADGTHPRDYKFFCFNGVAKVMYIVSDRFANQEMTYDFYDMNFDKLPFRSIHPNSDMVIDKPENFDEMRELAEKLAEGFPHIRVDFYDIDGKIYFGELTLAHGSGFEYFEPYEWDIKMGSWLELPK